MIVNTKAGSSGAECCNELHNVPDTALTQRQIQEPGGPRSDRSWCG